MKTASSKPAKSSRARRSTASRVLAHISVSISSEAEEPVAALLERLFLQTPTIQIDVRTGRTVANVYLERPAEGLSAKIDQLRTGLRELKAFGLKLGPGRISLKKLRRENWAESWKRHFPPIDIGAALLVKPAWSKRRPKKDQAVVILNPGLSFGTGQHPTTYFCLEQLVACRTPGRPQSCLDVGTGSGILAIAAAKLGYSPVVAFDLDPEAIRVAQANARQNRVADQIEIACRDLTRLPQRHKQAYDVVCANLTHDLLLQEKPRILDRLHPEGVLILAGILRSQFGAVGKEYAKSGLRLLRSRTEKEWKSGAFVFGERGRR